MRRGTVWSVRALTLSLDTQQPSRQPAGIWKREKTCHCEELEATKQSLVPLRLLRYARNDLSRQFPNTF